VVYSLAGLINDWPAAAVGHIPVSPSYKWDPVAVLVRLTWMPPRRSLWVPGHANRWNTKFVLVHVTPDENDRRSEEGLWLHWTDVVTVLPTEPSTAPLPPDPQWRARVEEQIRASWSR
jgi:hypothetical protein